MLATRYVLSFGNLEYVSRWADCVVQEDVLAPDNPPIMPAFIQNSIIYLDNQKCDFVFEGLCLILSIAYLLQKIADRDCLYKGLVAYCQGN